MLYVVGIRHEAKQECYYEAYTNVDDAVKRASDYHNDTNIVVSVEEYFSAAECTKVKNDAVRNRVKLTKDSIVSFINGM